jgi:hypothetical protein
MKEPLIICVDFDHTLYHTDYPDVGHLYPNAKETMDYLLNIGAYIIINTCRTGKALYQAQEQMFFDGIIYHSINDHCSIIKDKYYSDHNKEENFSRKIFCDILIDDTSLDWMLNGHPGWDKIKENVIQIVKNNPNKWAINQI